MAYLYVIFFLAHASTSFAQDCMSCRCFDVEQKAYPISNFVDGSPFYVQSISPPMMYNDYDTICLDFIPINGFVNTTLVQVKYTTNDMKQIPVEYIESQIVPGLFSGVGPSFPDYNVQSAGSLGYKDYVLTESCPNVFLIYRCELIGRNPGCPMMRKQATVMVISSERNAQEACIDNEKVYAEFINDFTDIKFYDLPNKAVNPCSPRPGQMPASGPPPASADDTNILKITGLLHI